MAVISLVTGVSAGEGELGRPGPGLTGAGTGDDYEIWSWAPLQSEATLQERQIV